VDLEDLLALLVGRQVHEEDLIEPPAADHLRRQEVDAVGGGGHEDELPALLHPGQELGEDAGRHPVSAWALMPISISSIQRMAGATLSMKRTALWNTCSAGP